MRTSALQTDLVNLGEDTTFKMSHLICFELPHNIDQDAAVKHRVAIDGGDVVSNFLNTWDVRDQNYAFHSARAGNNLRQAKYFAYVE